MAEKRFKLDYDGSVFWLIFWLIIFFPIAFVLLLTAASCEINGKLYKIKYDGSRFWLCFWVLVFFPVAFLLLFINGVSVSVKDIEAINPNPITPYDPTIDSDKDQNK